MSYDPTDCELGICGPCDRCQEQIEEEAIMGGDPLDCRSDCGHCERCLQDEEDDEETWGDEIPEVSNMSEPEQKTPTGTIDLTPSWVSAVTIYLEVLRDSGAGDHAKKLAHAEILRAAKLADLYVKEHKR